ncbi:uncharacterized protein METZ01_LOCUS260752 [marine metagenome]|uniref:Uncharacterized protein n=1 Tax=marine metagenome TaxID=408172 RepID=A0A382J7Y8_9ZZZZ
MRYGRFFRPEEVTGYLLVQVIHGAGVRFVPPRGPGLMIEFRNHHISNAGTAGTNLGINAATLMAGVQWVLR